MKIFKLLSFIIILFFINSVLINSFAQVVTLNDVTAFRIKNVEEIKENDEIKGYCAFYIVDKKDRKTNNCVISIFDINLNKKNEIKLERPVNSYFIETSYNGNTFCFSFLNKEPYGIDYCIYDLNGNFKGKYSRRKLTIFEYNQILKKIEFNQKTNYGETIAVKEKGYVKFSLDTLYGKSSTIEFLDNQANKTWSLNEKSNDNYDYVLSYPMANTNDLMAVYTYFRKGIYSSQFFNHSLKFINLNDGSLNFEFPCKTENNILIPLGVNFENDTIIVYGEYFNLKDNIVKNNSVGLFFIMLDKNGKKLSEKFSNWKENIDVLVHVDSLKNSKIKSRMALHKIIKTTENKYYAIGEQYERNINILGMMGYGRSYTQIDLKNIILFTFNSNFNIENVTVFQKKMRTIYLPSEMDFLGTTQVAYYLKKNGMFDYETTTVTPNKIAFSSIFWNYNKSLKKYFVNIISLSEDKQLLYDNVQLDAKSTYFKILPAKYGYFAVFEYFKKTKELNIRLEKLNL